MELTHTAANGKVTRKEPVKTGPPYSLLRLDAEAVRNFWPKLIRPGLEIIKLKDRHSGHWVPEHVRQRIDAGHLGQMFCECHLIVPVASTKPCGFVVLRMYNDEFINVPLSLFVWLTYCTDPAAMKYVIPLLEQRARDIGVRYIDGITSRGTWLRRIRRFGFRAHQTIIRKEIL